MDLDGLPNKNPMKTVLFMTSGKVSFPLPAEHRELEEMCPEPTETEEELKADKSGKNGVASLARTKRGSWMSWKSRH